MRLIKLVGISFLIAIPYAALSAAQSERPIAASPLTVLKSREPKVTWAPSSLLKGDFDFDGVEDYAAAGRAGSRYVVGIVKGPVTAQSKHWTLGFSNNPNDQGSLCSVETAHISIEAHDFDGAELLPPNSKGIDLSDEACDSFHIYWDVKRKRFVWSRN